MKNRLEFDTFMISLGLATVVLQWGLDRQERKVAERQEQYVAQASVSPVMVRKAPEHRLTFPEGSPYLDLTWPDSVQPNPFEQVEQIRIANAGNPDWAGKDTDMRLLLEAHEGQPYYFVLQQQAANEMLRHELFHHYYQDPTSPYMLEGISFYTQQLVQAKSEDAKLIYMSLRALRNYWPKKKIAEAARLTANRVLAKANVAQIDTSTTFGYHTVVYARELKKMHAASEKNK